MLFRLFKLYQVDISHRSAWNSLFYRPSPEVEATETSSGKPNSYCDEVVTVTFLRVGVFNTSEFVLFSLDSNDSIAVIVEFYSGNFKWYLATSCERAYAKTSNTIMRTLEIYQRKKGHENAGIC